jgi:hypothetical protein
VVVRREAVARPDERRIHARRKHPGVHTIMNHLHRRRQTEQPEAAGAVVAARQHDPAALDDVAYLAKPLAVKLGAGVDLAEHRRHQRHPK